MPDKKRDLLLLAAKLTLYFFIGMLALVTLMLTIGIPVSIIFQDQIVAEAASHGINAGPEIVGAILLFLVSLIILCVGTGYFLLLLLRIVNSVSEGDPFVPANAMRLSRMGWLALGSQLAMIPLGAMTLWLESITENAKNVHIDAEFGLSGEGMLLALVLFILARVFRKGTDMREELEGTV